MVGSKVGVLSVVSRSSVGGILEGTAEVNLKNRTILVINARDSSSAFLKSAIMAVFWGVARRL